MIRPDKEWGSWWFVDNSREKGYRGKPLFFRHKRGLLDNTGPVQIIMADRIINDEGLELPSQETIEALRGELKGR